MIRILVCLLVLALCSTLSPESTYRLYFTKINGANIAKFELTAHYLLYNSIFLPYFLKKALLDEMMLTYVEIAMGHFTAPAKTLLPPRGIKIMANTPISYALFKKLSSSFSSSIEAYSKFNIRLPEIMLYSDPDDIFCTYNVLAFSRLLPCFAKSGIFAAIDFNKAIGKQYFGIRLKINRTDSGLFSTLQVFLQYDPNDPFISLKNSRLQKCDLINNTMVISDTEVEIDAVPRIVLTDAVLNPIKNIKLPKVFVESTVVGGWYRQLSHLLIKVSVYTAYNVTIAGHLPKNFIPLTYYVMVMSGGEKAIYEIKWTNYKMCPNEVSSQQTFIISTYSHNSTLTIYIPYERIMKSFEEYESTNRGGYEIMGITVIVANQTWFTDSMTDRLPEPDFSLPFKVITFTMAIMGYFWVTLWRTFIEATKI